MRRCIVSPQAARDIRIVFDHIAADSENAARRLVAEFDKAFYLLADMPGLGHTRSDLTAKPVRFWPIRKRYLIVYRPIEDDIFVARVLDGHRNIAELL